jgi:MerR family transcriptional regulator, heat shock protein HspR
MKRNGLYSIKAVSELTHLPPSTLRFWEKVFQESLSPVRTIGGQRRYNEQNIAIIQKIQKLKEEGIPISIIKKHLTPVGQEENRNGDPVDLLADSLVKVIRDEVYRFFVKDGRTPSNASNLGELP